MNAGGNYNRPKVAKFLVGWVPTRTNGIMMWRLSWRCTRRKCKCREDATYPQLDEKTPWSFTIVWYWYITSLVQYRWEPKGDSEIPPLRSDVSNLFPWIGEERQYLMGSLTGAVASQNVTEAFTKVGLVRMEIGLDVQTQKPALLKGLPPDQSRKRKLVIRPYDIGRRKLNG